jgi:hypothetical protein
MYEKFVEASLFGMSWHRLAGEHTSNIPAATTSGSNVRRTLPNILAGIRFLQWLMDFLRMLLFTRPPA